MDIKDRVDKLKSFVEAADYAGYDPFDALNSPFVKAVSSRSKTLRMVFTQLLRRSPVNLRSVLSVEKGHNPKGIGLFLGGYAKLYSLNNDESLKPEIEYLLELLESLKAVGYSGNSWGYNFDWQSRTTFRPKGTPTIVNSSFIGHALLDCYELTGSQRALEMALPIRDFILNDIKRVDEGQTFGFSYTPVDNSVVHNANMMGASIIIRLNKYAPDQSAHQLALAALAYSMNHQESDGSWYYADTDCQKWIDSFHTGFNLQALRYIIADGEGAEYLRNYESGVEFYADNFFLNDGTPKYYYNKIYPVDIHSPAQAIYFFSGMGEKYLTLTENVLRWMLNHMQSPEGYFYFRKGRLHTNKICYMRWSQAWAFHALVEYMFQKQSVLKSVKPG